MLLFKNKYRVESARLQNWDYSWNGKYFVTIVTKNREHYFGNIVNGEMRFSEIGKIANECWCAIPEHFPFVVLDEFCVMPNHTHGIIVINNQNDNECRDVACNVSTDNVTNSKKMSNISPNPGSLSTIIRSYKSAVTKSVNENNYNFVWQPRFYEHIIRNEKSLFEIRKYIKQNSLKWKIDLIEKENPLWNNLYKDL